MPPLSDAFSQVFRAHIEQILGLLKTQLDADFICAHINTFTEQFDLPDRVPNGLHTIIVKAVDGAPAGVPIPIEMDALEKMPFSSGIATNLGVHNGFYCGWLACFFSRAMPGHQEMEAAFALFGYAILSEFRAHQAEYAHKLHEYLDQTIQQASHIGSLQRTLNLMTGLLREMNTYFAAILLYQSDEADLLALNVDHVRLSASWLNEVGGGVGIGTRWSVSPAPALLDMLVQAGELDSSQDSVQQAQKGAFLSGMLNNPHIKAWMAFSLHTQEHQLGILFVSTQREGGFNALERQLLHKLRAFLNVATAAAVYQESYLSNQYAQATLIEAVNDGVMVAQPAPNGAVTSLVNERFCHLFQVQAGAVMGTKLDKLLAQMQLPAGVRQNLNHLWNGTPLRDPNTQVGEFEMIGPGGQPMQISWYSSPIYDPSAKNTLARLYIFHDATPERAAVQVRSAFLSRVSHELRTPLTSISGYAQLIQEGVPPGSPTHEHIRVIMESATHLKHVFSQLIDITRAYAGEITLYLQPISLADMLEASRRAHHRNGGDDFELSLLYDDALPTVEADPERINRVLQALLDNALKHSPPGGTVHMSARVVRHHDDSLPPGSPPDMLLPVVLVSVFDSGPGLQPEDCERVFEPFYRAAATEAARIEGAGLGLAVARSIIDLHKGSIWAQPATNESPGGRFFFALPLTEGGRHE